MERTRGVMEEVGVKGEGLCSRCYGEGGERDKGETLRYPRQEESLKANQRN